MSALTKTFVVLHVILSMVLVSALVVFVNRTEDFRTLNKAATDKFNAAKTDAANAAAETISVKTAMQQQLNAKDASLATQREAIAADQTTIGGLNGQIADLASKNAMAHSARPRPLPPCRSPNSRTPPLRPTTARSANSRTIFRSNTPKPTCTLPICRTSWM